MHCYSERREESLINSSGTPGSNQRCFASLNMTKTSARAWSKNFAGARGYLDVNCVMVQRALCVALGLFGSLLPAVAQQPHRSISREQSRSNSMSNAPLSLSLYRPKTLGAVDSSLLLHNGSVPLWLDGAQVGNGGIDPGSSFVSQWVQMGFSDLFPAALLSAAPPSAQRPSAGRVQGSDGKDLGADGKDSPETLNSSPNSVYCGGEVGVLYGRSSGKGGGDMWETYVEGTVGNDKFQITAGAQYDEWSGNGRGLRFRSFAAPR
jgi:hypothetical protein